MSSVDYVQANEDIVQDTKDLVLTQFNESENIQKLIELIADEFLTYEEVAEKLFTAFLLESASGYALDLIGEFVNVPREDRSDDDYRTALIIVAVGSSASITRDSIYTLVEIVTGGVGGYMYSGRYHDLYLYLQDSCSDRDVAADFLDDYLPVNTQASVIFESGLGFGFEGNDLARGLSRVYQRPSEGYAYIEVPLDSVNTDDLTISNSVELVGADGYTYRTDEEVELTDTVWAYYWDIPSDYVTSDSVEISVRNNKTNDIFKDSLTITDTATAQSEIADFLTDFFVDNGITTLDNIYVDTSSSYEIYIGFEDGLTVPLSDPIVQGFDGPYTITLTAPYTSNQKYFSRIPVSNLTYGEIPVSAGMAFTPSESLGFTYNRIEAGADFYSGYGTTGMIVPDESFSEAGGLASRASLTSLDILGYSAQQDPSDYLYELNSRYAGVLSFAPNDTITVKPIQTISEYDTFSPPEWDSGLSGDTDPMSYGIALRSPSGTSVYKPCISEEFFDDQLGTMESLSISEDVYDIDLPAKPYYYEVSFPEIPNSPASPLLMFSKVLISTPVSDDEEITRALTATVYCRYDSDDSEYTVGVKFEQTSLKMEGIGTGTNTVTEEYSLVAEPYSETGSDLTSLNGITFGFLIDPSVSLYVLYVNGEPYDGESGTVLVTSVSGIGAPDVSSGDIYSPVSVTDSRALFGIAGYTDNSEAEPSGSEYGSVKFTYDREDLAYTEQLPTSAVDIFGRTIS